jgi:hypothetical protein
MKRSTRTSTPAPQTLETSRALARPGRIAFDDRGNAVYEWQEVLQADNAHADLLRKRALNNPTLSIVEDDGAAKGAVRDNKVGVRVGYDPYESGLLSKKRARKKIDMQALSRWISLKKQVAGGKL